MHMCAGVCVSQMTTLVQFIKVSFETCALVVTWGSPTNLGRLTSKPCAYFNIASVGVRRARHRAWLFTWEVGDQTEVLVVMQQAPP